MHFYIARKQVKDVALMMLFLLKTVKKYFKTLWIIQVNKIQIQI